MANINRTILVGNCTRDPELKAIGETSVCSLRLAVNERVRNRSTGEWEERANYFDVTVWGKQGESCARFLSKGRPCAVDGRLRWREWTTEDGSKRQAVDIVADTVQFLGGRDERRQDSSDIPADTAGLAPVGGGSTAPVGGADDDVPFAREADRFEFDLWHAHENR